MTYLSVSSLSPFEGVINIRLKSRFLCVPWSEMTAPVASALEISPPPTVPLTASNEAFGEQGASNTTFYCQGKREKKFEATPPNVSRERRQKTVSLVDFVII